MQGIQPLLLGPAGDRLSREKAEFPEAQRLHRHTKHALQIPGKIFRSRIVRCQNEKRPVQPDRKRGGKICPVYCGKTGNKRRKPAALRQIREGSQLLMAQNLVY